MTEPKVVKINPDHYNGSYNEHTPDAMILHCADTPDTAGDTYGFEQINNWHKQNGWIHRPTGISCGYNFIIRRSGVIEYGRPMDTIGAHCRGHNRGSLGVCYVGRKIMTPEQITSLVWLYKEVNKTYNISIDNVCGHYEFDSKKTCPNQDMNVIRALLRATA